MYLGLQLKELKEFAEKEKYSSGRPDIKGSVQMVYKICGSKKKSFPRSLDGLAYIHFWINGCPDGTLICSDGDANREVL